MPIFRKAVDRLADLMRCDRKVTYRAFIDARLAPYVTQLPCSIWTSVKGCPRN